MDRFSIWLLLPSTVGATALSYGAFMAGKGGIWALLCVAFAAMAVWITVMPFTMKD